MKICFIANAVSPHTWKWANAYIDKGWEVHIISHEPFELKGAIVHYIPYSLKGFFKYKSIVHKKIGEINPNVLHAHQFNDCGLYGVTYEKIPCVVSAWGSDILLVPKRSKIVKIIVKYIVKKATIITSDSNDVTENLIALGGNPNKIYTFPMGIPDKLLVNKCTINEEKSLKILSTRRLETLYNIDVIIDGFALALKEEANLELTIGAMGTVEEELKDQVSKLNIKDKVIFTGMYNEEQLGAMLRENEVFISIPSSDATSVSLLEAMGCGLYPVLSDLPSNREWVNHGENGLVVKAINSIDVKEAILYCFKNKTHLEAAKAINIKLIEDKALWKNNIKIVEEIYNKVKV